MTKAKMTEQEAHKAAVEAFGRAIISSSRTIMPNGTVVVCFEVGVAGDNWSWTIMGRGESWEEALEEAKKPGARTRPAFRGPSKGGLDI